MSLTFPRKFVHGQTVGSADVTRELHFWPNASCRRVAVLLPFVV